MITRLGLQSCASLLQINNLCKTSICSIQTSAVNQKLKAGRYKRTRDVSKPLTYEMARPPPDIASKKAWNTWNTGSFRDGIRRPEISIEDMFIRRFMAGTFHRLIPTEIVIKRQYNLIRVTTIMTKKFISPAKMYFLLGYTEEMLSQWIKSPVKLEIQFVDTEKDVIYRYI